MLSTLKRRSLAIGLALAAVPAGVAVADNFSVDGDTASTATTGKDFGAVDPAQEVSAGVEWALRCTGNAHIDAGQSFKGTYDAGASSVPSGGTVLDNGGVTIPRPSAWPADGQTCGGIADALGSATVKLKAPAAAGSKTFALKYATGFDPAKDSDPNNIKNGASLTYTMTVRDVAPVISSFTGAESAREGDTKTYAFTATDANETTPAKSLEVTAQPQANAASVSGMDVTFTKTGTYKLRAVATDGTNTTRSAEKTVEVSPLDSTPPVITPSITGTKGDNDWYTTNVGVSFTVVDQESAITSRTAGCDGLSVTSDTTGTTVSCQATSAGGTADPVNVTIKRDTAKPVIIRHSSLDGCDAPGLNGWCTGTQKAGFSASDATSGLANNEDSPYAFTRSETQNGSSVSISSGTLRDKAGHEADSVSAGPFKIDSVAPSVSVTGVSDGSTYPLGSVPVAGCDTTDATSDVKDAATVGVTGGTSNGVGSFTATCSGANDQAGNAASAVSAAYKVEYLRDGGILQPINPDGTSAFSQKRAVPVKFQLAGDPATGFEVGSWKLRREAQSCGVESFTPENLESTTTSSSTVLRYDATADQYIANATLSGTSVDKCYRFVVDFDDGTSLASAKFKVAR